MLPNITLGVRTPQPLKVKFQATFGCLWFISVCYLMVLFMCTQCVSCTFGRGGGAGGGVAGLLRCSMPTCVG